MNTLKKTFFTYILLSFVCLSTIAQTIVWQMPLSQYDNLEYWGMNLWLASKNGKIGLIKADGSIVVPIENSNISDFYEHKALLTTNDSHGERIMGVLTDMGQYHQFNKKCYTLTGQKFFSDGLLSVSDENGSLGYVDESGNPIIGFNGKYDRIKPFTEGYAAVFKNRKYHLIDKEGLAVRFLFNGVGEVYGGTNVYKGLAYVWDTDGKYYTYDTQKRGACKSTKVSGAQQGFDYLYRFMSISQKTKEVPYVKVNKNTTKGISPNIENGLYGYKIGEQEIIPCQFQNATTFENGYAIVTLNGQKGIIKYIHDESFDASNPISSYNYYEGNSISCSFKVTIPSAWQGKGIDITLKDGNQSINIQQNGYSFNFQVKPNTKSKQYSLEIESNGLRLYRTNLTYVFNKKERCHTCGKDKDACPYHGKHPEKPIVKKTSTKDTQTNEHKEKICPTCGLPLSKCKYQGVH